MNRIEYIASFSIFAGASEQDLTEILRYSEVLDFDSGETIFRESDKASNIYGLLEGEVELVLVIKDKILKTDVQFEEYARINRETVERDIVVDSVKASEIFGWAAFLPEGHYTSEAVTVCASKVFVIKADNLKDYFSSNPHVGYPFMERLIAIVAKRLTSRTNKLIEGWSEAFSVNKI